MQEKVEHLRVSFPSLKPEEVMTALNDENGRTDRAAALLQLYVQDDAEVAAHPSVYPSPASLTPPLAVLPFLAIPASVVAIHLKLLFPVE